MVLRFCSACQAPLATGVSGVWLSRRASTGPVETSGRRRARGLTGSHRPINLVIMKEFFNNAQGWLNGLQGQLRENGYRITRARLSIARALAQSQDWQRPEDLLTSAQQDCPSLSLVTVYRTLELFAQLGFVRRVHTSEGCHGYTRALLAHGHHLTCRSCQRVIEFPGAEGLQDFIASIQRETGFLIQDHMLELQGLCPTCQETAS